jgi:hypothetical protein
MGLENVVHPMDPRYLKSLLSTSALSKEQIQGILDAVNKFNEAINIAGKEFESDLEKCLNNPISDKNKQYEK